MGLTRSNMASAAASDPPSSRDWWIAGAVALAAGFLRALNCARRGFWIDEYHTLIAARLPIPEMVAERFAQSHTPLYFLYARLGPLFGNSEWALRLTSVLMVVIAILTITGLARALRLRRCLPAIWALALVNPYWFTIGTQYRYMMMLVAFCSLTGWLAVRYAAAWNWRRGVALALALGVLLWLHPSMQFLAPVFGTFLVWEAVAQNRRFSLSAVAAAMWPILMGLLICLPQAFFIGTKKIQAGPRKLDFSAFMENIGETAFGNPLLWPRHFGISPLVLSVPMVSMLIVVLWLARRRLRADGNPAAWRFLASWFPGLPLFYAFFSWKFHHMHEETRYICTVSLPATILIAVAWRAGRTKFCRWAFRAGLVLILSIQIPAVVLDRGDLHREAARWVIRNHSGGEPVILASFPTNAMAMGYLGFSHPELLGGPPTQGLTEDRIYSIVRDRLKGHNRAFFIFYFEPNEMFDAMNKLKQADVIVEKRVWRYSGLVTIVAAGLDPSQRAWLQNLPDPNRPWGPACGDNRFNPRFNIPKKRRY